MHRSNVMAGPAATRPVAAPNRARATGALALALAASCAATPPDAGATRSPDPVAVRRVGAARPRADALPPVPSAPLTIERAVELALARNPDLDAAEARVAAAQAEVARSRASMWPLLSADATVMRSDAPSAFLFKAIDAHVFQPSTDFNDPGTFDNTEAGLGLRWNLFDGGRDGLNVRAARLGEQASRLGRQAVLNALAAAVVGAWLDARAAGELGRADDASVSTVEAQVKDLESRVAGGAALRSDLLSLQVRLAEARERRLRTGLAQRLALANLRSLLALEPDTPLELSDGAFPTGALPDTLEAARMEAFAARPELAAARLAVDRAQLAQRAAARAWLPRLDAMARLWGGTDDVSLDLNEANASAALSLSFDLFDGGARRAGRDAARAGSRAALAEAHKASIGIALDVEGAWLRLEEARARSNVSSQAVGASEETLDLVETQFRGGSATVTRYLESESARTAARSAHIRAELDVEHARIELARALGRLGGRAEGAGTEGNRR